MPRYKPIALKHDAFTRLCPEELRFVVEYVQDYNARRAATVIGLQPERGHEFLKVPRVVAALEIVASMRVELSDIDKDWVLLEAKENLHIAKQKGLMSAANTALNIIAKHRDVDAFAAEKVKIDSDDDVMDRLKRGRKRKKKLDPSPHELISFL